MNFKVEDAIHKALVDRKGSLSVELELVKNKKDDKKKQLNHVACENSTPLHKRVLMIDVALSEGLNAEGYELKYLSLKELVGLKNKNRRQVKRLIQTHHVISVPERGSDMLKNFGKTFQLYCKTPSMIPYVKASDLDHVCKRSYYRVLRNHVYGKIGYTYEDYDTVKQRLDGLISTLTEQGKTIKSGLVKATYGKPYKFVI